MPRLCLLIAFTALAACAPGDDSPDAGEGEGCPATPCAAGQTCSSGVCVPMGNPDDFTSPRIVSTTPSAYSLEVGTTIELTFDEPVRIKAGSVLVKDSQTYEAIPYTHDLSADGLVLRVTPDVTPRREIVISTFPFEDFSGNTCISAEKYFTYPVWLGLSSPTIPSGAVTSQVSLALADSGDTLVAYSLPVDNSAELWVKRCVRRPCLNGWSALGSPVPMPGTRQVDKSIAPVVAVDGEEVVLAYVAQGTPDAVVVTRWTGSQWEQLGGAPLAEGSIRDVSMVRAEAGVWIIAYIEGGNLHVRRWNGSSWTAVGTVADATLSEYTEAELSLDPAGMPYVAYRAWTTTATTVAQVIRWTGTAWVRAFEDSTLAGFLSIAFHPTAAPLLGWAAAGPKLMAGRWTDSGLAEATQLNVTAQSLVGTMRPRVSQLSNGDAYAIFGDNGGEIFCSVNRGAGWQPLAAKVTSHSAGSASYHEVAVVNSDTRGPYVAFLDNVLSNLRIVYLNR